MVGSAITIGLNLYQVAQIEQNKDAMINDLFSMAAIAQQHLMKTESMEGGNGSFTEAIDFTIPLNLKSNDNGIYKIVDILESEITLRRESASNEENAIEVSVNKDGRFLVGSGEERLVCR